MGRRERRKEKRMQRWGQIAIGLLLVLLMVVSILQVSMSPEGNGKIRFNEHSFTPTPEGFHAKINGEKALYQFAPIEGNTTQLYMQAIQGGVVLINGNPQLFPTIQQATYVGITFDPYIDDQVKPFIDLFRFELGNAWQNTLNGVLENSTEYPALKEMTCEMATPQLPIILLEINASSNQGFSNITFTENCAHVYADPIGFLATLDYFLLGKQGVIPDAD
jgi:hypothetical protein